MAEFGEKVKRAREEKGMTQQSLSEHLYVTRQAVSRWECGARYPDLLNAKKLADILEVFLDELLSGEEMIKYVEKSPIVESPDIGRIQSALYGFAGAAYLFMSIFGIRFMVSWLSGGTLQDIGYSASYIIGYMITALLLFCGLVLSVCGKLTPKKTGMITAAYFGKDVLSNIFACMQVPGKWGAVFQIMLYLIFAAMTVRYYFCPRRITPIPVYSIAVFYFLRSGTMYFQMIQLENELAFVVRTIWLTAIAGYMGLIVYQAYVLEKKWRLAMK